MAKRRLRLRRKAAVLLLLLLALFLLDLNRYLPGQWPGGGGDGGLRHWPENIIDPYRVRPPEGEPPEMPTEGITVVMLAPGGGPYADAFVGADREGATEQRTDARGQVVLRDARVLDAGLRVRRGATVVRHGPVDPSDGGAWTVHIPETTVPPAPPAPGVEVEIVAAEDGSPLASATLHFESAAGQRQTTTGADGTVTVDGLEIRTLLHVDADGRTPVQRWIHPAEEGAVRIRLSRTQHLDVRFLDDTTGSKTPIAMLRVISKDGVELWRWQAGLLDVDPPATIETDADLTDALLEVHAEAHPVVRVPLEGLAQEIRLPAGRAIEVRALDLHAQPTVKPRVRAQYVPDVLGGHAPGSAEPLEVSVETDRVARVPAGSAARLLVEASGSAPRAVDVAPEDTSGRLDVRLAVGLPLEVKVIDTAGTPVELARVFVLASAEGMRVSGRAVTGEDGTAKVLDLPTGPVEVYARARGMAWSARPATVMRDGDVVELVLEPGHALRMVVESTLGLPLEGARVHATSLDDTAIDVVAPDAEPSRTQADGTVVLRDLPDREYRLRISHPGYHETLIPKVRPGPGVHFVTLVPRD